MPPSKHLTILYWDALLTNSSGFPTLDVFNSVIVSPSQPSLCLAQAFFNGMLETVTSR